MRKPGLNEAEGIVRAGMASGGITQDGGAQVLTVLNDVRIEAKNIAFGHVVDLNRMIDVGWINEWSAAKVLDELEPLVERLRSLAGDRTTIKVVELPEALRLLKTYRGVDGLEYADERAMFSALMYTFDRATIEAMLSECEWDRYKALLERGALRRPDRA